MTGVTAIVVFVVGLVGSIMVHEWGHFATARRFGMRARRFFLGFGPTVWSRHVGETEYGVKALPLGGFVSIAGMTPGDEREPGVPAALHDEIEAGADPVEAFARLLDERGAPKDVRELLVTRFRRTIEAGSGAIAGAPTGADLEREDFVRPDERREGVGDRSSAGPARSDTIARTVDHDHDHAHGAEDHDAHAVATGLAPDVDPVMLSVELIHSEVVPTGRVGDLHHRLTKGDEGRFFGDRPGWQRAIVLASGALLHFLQAALLIFLGWLIVGEPVTAPVVSSFADARGPDGEVVPSAAREAGMQIGDRIVAIGGTATDEFEEIRVIIEENAGTPLDVTIEREDVEDRIELTVTPAAIVNDQGETVGLLGFRPTPDNRPLGADAALYATFVGEGSFPDLFVRTIAAVGDVFGPEGVAGVFSQVAGEEERDPNGGISIIGAANAAGAGTDAFGPLFLFILLAQVNVFVGIFNALPLPPLDGGHLAVLGVEEAVNARRRRTGKPADYSVDPRTVASIALPVIALVVTVSLAFLYLDIVQPLSLE